jgi:hypothetical protein
MPDEHDTSAISATCHDVLRGNWREGRRHADGVPFAYTCPSPRHYPWQWYWDSCFTAIAWRHFDPERSRRELASLLAAQRGDGFIGHTIFWNTPLRGARRFTYNVLTPGAPMTASIQPPALAWAWSIAVGDPAGEPAIVAHHAWLVANRTLDADGLLWIVQPDESGMDASPQFDAIWGQRAHAQPGYIGLVHRNRRLRYDLRRIAARGGPICCEPLTNVLYSLSRTALGLSSLTEAIVARMYDQRSGLFTALARPAARTPPALTWAALAPLALPDLPEPIGRRLIEEQLLRTDRFWLPMAPPSVAATDRKFSRTDVFGPLRQRRYWRGPTWINACWLMWLGLLRLGYARQAHELAGRAAAAVHAGGLREYYDPYTSAGMGARQFGWSSLIMEMIAPDARAANSYISDR